MADAPTSASEGKTRSIRNSVLSMGQAARSSMMLHMVKDDEQLPLNEAEGGKSDVYATTMNLITIMVGAGVLSYPSLFKTVGIVYGTPMVLACGALSAYLCQTLGDAIGLVQSRTGKRVNKLDDLGDACFGYSGALAARIIVNGMFIGKVGCYMVLIGQNFSYLIPLPYRVWILVFAGLTMVTAFARDVSILEKMAIVGVIASGIYFITITGGSIQAGNSDHTFVAAPTVEFAKLFSVLTIMMFGFGPTDVLATVRREMKDSRELPKALIVSHLVVGLIYLSAGIVGYWGFGTAVEGNISRSMCDHPGCPGTLKPGCKTDVCESLTNDNAGKKWIFGFFLAGAVVANLLVTIPIVLYCLFTGIEANYPKDRPMDPLSNTIMRVGVVSFCACVGLFVPFFLQVVGIISAVLVVPVVFFLPLILGWKAGEDSGEPYSLPRKIFTIAALLLGVACLIIGTYESVTDLAEAVRKDPDASNPFNNFFK